MPILLNGFVEGVAERVGLSAVTKKTGGNARKTVDSLPCVQSDVTKRGTE
jgi:hypothetical protein